MKDLIRRLQRLDHSICSHGYKDTAILEAIEALQQARRQGWEQGKTEAVDICINGFKRGLGDKFQGDVFADAIAAIKYKEKVND